MLRAMIEPFNSAEVEAMDRDLLTVFNNDTNVAESANYSIDFAELTNYSDEVVDSIESDYNYDYGQNIDVAALNNRTLDAARQVIYHETTSAARLHLLVTMNQMYSIWATRTGRVWSSNPIHKCEAIRLMLKNDMNLIPIGYREDIVSGWLLFCGSHNKFE